MVVIILPWNWMAIQSCIGIAVRFLRNPCFKFCFVFRKLRGRGIIENAVGETIVMCPRPSNVLLLLFDRDMNQAK